MPIFYFVGSRNRQLNVHSTNSISDTRVSTRHNFIVYSHVTFFIGVFLVLLCVLWYRLHNLLFSCQVIFYFSTWCNVCAILYMPGMTLLLGSKSESQQQSWIKQDMGHKGPIKTNSRKNTNSNNVVIQSFGQQRMSSLATVISARGKLMRYLDSSTMCLKWIWLLQISWIP